jgi:hypothetical protein
VLAEIDGSGTGDDNQFPKLNELLALATFEMPPQDFTSNGIKVHLENLVCGEMSFKDVELSSERISDRVRLYPYSPCPFAFPSYSPLLPSVPLHLFPLYSLLFLHSVALLPPAVCCLPLHSLGHLQKNAFGEGISCNHIIAYKMSSDVIRHNHIVQRRSSS